MNTQQEYEKLKQEGISKILEDANGSWYDLVNDGFDLAEKLRQSTHPIAADAEALAKEFAGTNYTKNHFPRRYQDRIDGYLAGFKAGYASQPKGAGVAKSFLSVLEENYQAQIAGYYNHDKTYVEKQRRNAVIEEYKDLIAIFKSNFSSIPSQEGQQTK